MHIIHLTDIHGAGYLIDEIAAEIKNSDLVIISGDITHFGKEKEAFKIIEKIERYNKKIFAITGNCDHLEIEKYLEKKEINLHRNIRKVGNINFFGISGSLPCPGTTPNEYTDDNAGKWLNDMTEKLDNSAFKILVSHQPPINTVNDMVSDNIHVGSSEIRKYIENHKPILCLTGHIHEGIGIDSIENCIIVNPGPFRTGKYAVINIKVDGSTKIELKQITA